MFGLGSDFSSSDSGFSAFFSIGLLSYLTSGLVDDGFVTFLGGFVALVEVSATSFLGYDGFSAAYSFFS